MRLRNERLRRPLLILIAAGLLGSIGGGVHAAFFSSTSSTGNAFAAGSVVLGDNDGGSGAVVTLSNAQAGATDTGCIRLDYTGSLGATVRHYATVSGTLVPHLSLKVTRGADSSPSFRSCSSFTPDATNYIGAGAGVIYNGPLGSFPSTYAAGIVDPVGGSPETWTNPEVHSYKLEITVASTTAIEGLSGSATFRWEARNQ